tara:strand:- start:10216 stop:11040 length:825 start_codon:yes stop_codon:yes gene_type:complete
MLSLVKKLYRKYEINKISKNVTNLNDLSKESAGVLYVATGEYAFKEFLHSIKMLRTKNDIPVTVFTDQIDRESEVSGLGVNFISVNSAGLRSKVAYLKESPYDKTLYLDNDAFVKTDVSELFRILDVCDLAGAYCLSRKRDTYAKIFELYNNIPHTFSEVNTGVLVYTKNSSTQALFDRWQELYSQFYSDCKWDQPSFRVALWESGVKFHALCPEYNIRPKQIYDKVISSFGEEHLKKRIVHLHADRYGYDYDSEFNMKELDTILEKEAESVRV